MRYVDPGRGRRRRRADLAVTVALLAAGAVASALGPAEEAAVARAVRGSVLMPFLELHEAFTERARAARRLEGLRGERDSLLAETLRLRRLAESGRELRRIAGLGPLPGESFVPADLLPGRPRVGDADVFTLRSDGVGRVPTPTAVITGSGLVGVLRSAQGSGGRGEFWSHPDFRVSVRTADGGTTGIVRPHRGPDGQPAMVLEGAPYQGDVAPGTELLTTGLAGIYPPGVRVGTVTGVSRVESGWAKSYFVRPAVRPGEADLVLVWLRSEGGA